jgi:glutathione S-transferase
MTVHQLLGAEVSLYTGKVRAYLRYKAIPFREVLATRDVYQSVIVPRTGVRFIPVLISDRDVAIQDSTAIIDHLEERYPQGSVYPDGPLQRLVALLLEVYADEWLVIPAMHYRWNVPENRSFAIEEFGRLSAPEAEPALQREIGEKLSVPFAGALPALGVHPETRDAIEASYLALLAELDAHFSLQPFLLGSRPCIADFALYGPLYAHLYRDPASGRLMKERAPHVAAWVERMTSPQALSGSFLSNDELPPTLEPLLARMFSEQGPVLSSTLECLAAYSREGREGPVPRVIGKHTFTLAGARGERAIYSFNIWRWQRPCAHYHALPSPARERADALLHTTGGWSLLQSPLTALVRENNRLYLQTKSVQ